MEVKEKNYVSAKDKKEMAYSFFIRDANMTQKEIAARVGVSEVTMSGWVREGDWEKDRTSLLVSKTKQLKAMYDELGELNERIKKFSESEKKNVAGITDGDNAKELILKMVNDEKNYFKFAQIRRQLIKDIKSLESNVTKGTVMDVFINFGTWMQKNGVPLEKVKEVIELQDSFFKALA